MLKTTKQNTDVGIIVARFQSPLLHEGHREIIDTVCKNHPRVIVFLGLSPLRCTVNNPYDYSIRKAMLEETYPEIEVLYIDDVNDDELWSKNLDRMIAKVMGPNLKPVLYGSRDSFIGSYKGHYPTVELVPTKFISASEIRRRIGIKPKHTQDFREGIVHAVQNQFPSFKLTVDLAVVNFDKKELLLARKPNEGFLRFVGGFTDPKQDKCAEDAARREGLEETGLALELDKYVGSALIDDWRYRYEQDKIMTILFTMRYVYGAPKAQDDIEYLTWRKFGEITENEIMPEHRPLITMLNSHFNYEILRKA